MPLLSPNSNIAKRPTLMFACINIGVLGAIAWQYFQNGLPLGISVVAGLVSLVLFNGMAIFMYKRATGRQAKEPSK
jgi:hypothetical protein